MKGLSWIRSFLILFLFGWLIWCEKFVIESVFTAQTFGSARLSLGMAAFVLAAIIFVGLTLISIIEEWRFNRLMKKGDEQSKRGAPGEALESFIEAQRINDRWIKSRELRLCVLRRLSVVYRQLKDQPSCIDVEHRIQAIEASEEGTGIEKRMAEESMIIPKWEAVRKIDYAVAGIFSLLLLIAGSIILPGPTGFPNLTESFVRFAGAVFTTFVVAEAIAGKAHGGTEPTTAYWKENPYWFSIRSGAFLFAGILMTLRLDRALVVTHYWQLPANLKSWELVLGSLVLCFLSCYALGYLHEREKR